MQPCCSTASRTGWHARDSQPSTSCAGCSPYRPALPDRSQGLTRAVLIGAHTGSTHTGLMLVELADAGHVDTHLHSFESSFYVLSGEPVLYLDGRGVEIEDG